MTKDTSSAEPSTSESYTDPIASMRDPKTLRLKQFTRKMNWDSLISIVTLAGVILPIVLAFQQKSPLQVAKILYIPLSFGIAGNILNFPNVGLWISNIFWFIPTMIMVLIIAAINAMAPSPSWYTLIILAIFWIYWKTQRNIPQLEKHEWRLFKENTGMTDDEIKERLSAK